MAKRLGSYCIEYYWCILMNFYFNQSITSVYKRRIGTGTSCNYRRERLIGSERCLRCFGIDNIIKTILILDGDEFTTSKVTDSTGRIQDMFIVNKSGFYSTIMISRKPQAKVFKKWVANEFLPSIRKDGAYMTENTRKY